MSGFDDAWLEQYEARMQRLRDPVARGGVDVGGYALEGTGAERPTEPRRGRTRTAASESSVAGGDGSRSASGRQAGGSPALRVPARQLSTSRPGATAGQHAQAAAPAVNAEADAGVMVDGDVCAPRKLSTRAIAKLQPEQRLQIEVVAHWRPRLIPQARLLGINGELPGGGKLQRLRSAIRRDMGYVRGTPDLQAVRPGHTLWLEAKVGTDMTDEQALFAEWAHAIGHGYGVFTSIEDAGVLLKIHGFLA